MKFGEAKGILWICEDSGWRCGCKDGGGEGGDKGDGF